MRALIVGTAVVLAGCGGEEAATGGGNVAVPAASAQATGGSAGGVDGGALRLEPGRWRVDVALGAVEMPGMPAAIVDQVRASMKAQQNSTHTYCLSAQEAARPPGELFAGQPAGTCRTNKLSQANGRVSGELDCENQGVRTRVSVTGTATPTRYDMDIATAMDMSGMNVSVKARGVGERTGACAPGEK